MNLRCVVVDDSSIQRLSIVKLIKEHPSLTLLAEYKNALETKKGLNEVEVDLIFLDIQLSDGLSFEIFDAVDIKSAVIFTTAYDEYALQAFKLNSIDYLLKPIDDQDLETAVDKFRNRAPQKQAVTLDFNDIKNLLSNA